MKLAVRLIRLTARSTLLLQFCVLKLAGSGNLLPQYCHVADGTAFRRSNKEWPRISSTLRRRRTFMGSVLTALGDVYAFKLAQRPGQGQEIENHSDKSEQAGVCVVKLFNDENPKRLGNEKECPHSLFLHRQRGNFKTDNFAKPAVS